MMSTVFCCLLSHTWTLLLGLAATCLGAIPAITKDKLMEYCQSEFFVANCSTASGGGANDIIMIDSGQFGRMRAGRCLPGSHGNFDCSVDVSWYLDRQCMGSRQCRVYVADPVLHQVDPCSRDLASYLEAKYTCITAAPGSNLKAAEDECINNRQILLTIGGEDDIDRKSTSGDGERKTNNGRYGYIASETSTTTGLGTARCPYRIRAVDGRRVRLSMTSFSGGKRPSSAGGDADDLNAIIASASAASESGAKTSDRHFSSDSACHEVGSAWSYPDSELTGSGTSSIVQPQKLMGCRMQIEGRRSPSGQQRIDRLTPYVLFESESSEIVVELNSQAIRSDQAPFVIKYEVLGCPTPKAPSSGWIKLDKDSTTATVGCNATGDTWRMTCNANDWVLTTGRPSNCSQHIALTWRSNSIFSEDDGFPYGILLVVAIGVALGIFIGGTLLSVVAFCMKRQAASETAAFSPCETESLSAAYNSCTYHQPPFQHYQHHLHNQQQQQPALSRPIVHHGMTVADDRRYRTVCYPVGPPGGGPSSTSQTTQLGIPPLDDYDTKSATTTNECSGDKFFVSGGIPGSGKGRHLYESPHFDVIGATTIPMTSSPMSGPMVMQKQQSEVMTSPCMHGHKMA